MRWMMIQVCGLLIFIHLFFASHFPHADHSEGGEEDSMLNDLEDAGAVGDHEQQDIPEDEGMGVYQDNDNNSDDQDSDITEYIEG